MSHLGRIVRGGVVVGLIATASLATAVSAHTGQQGHQSFVELTGISLMAHARAGEDLPSLEVGSSNSALWPNILYGLNSESARKKSAHFVPVVSRPD